MPYQKDKSVPEMTVMPAVSIHQKILDRLVARVGEITDREGCTKTIVPYLSIYRHSCSGPLTPGIVSPSFCLILQGTKKLHLAQDILYYTAGDYLASVVDIPASGQVIRATPETPYIGLRIDFTVQEITSVIMEAKINMPSKNLQPSTAAFIGRSDVDLLKLYVRLLDLTNKPEKAPFLSELIKREMIYNLLTGEYGYLFLQKTLFDPQADGIGKAIVWINKNLSQSFTVKELAQFCNMSVSGLHHKFKAITTMGPLQYQKNLRLQSARRLMLTGSIDAGAAALEVGYESSSQFNREYRRLFGSPPFKDIKDVRKKIKASEF